jgi:hypothetical protein
MLEFKHPKLQKFNKGTVEKVKGLLQRVYESADDVANKDLFGALLEQEAIELARVIESSTTTADIDVVAKIVIPAIKKLAKDNIVSQIVGVQPIEMKGATVLYEDIEYANTTDEVNAGESIYDKTTTKYAQGVGEGQPINRQLKFVLKEVPVEIREKALLSSWTLEVDELASTLKIDIEKELGKAIAQKMDEEITYEVLYELRDNAKGFQATYQVPTASDTSAQRQEKVNDLIDKIYIGREEIYDKTGRYPNWIIVSPKLASMLKRNGVLTVFTPDSESKMTMQRLYQCGTLEDELTVFVVRGFNTDDVIMGYKGQSEFQTGYILAPITAIKIPPTFFDVRTYEFIKSLKRYYGVAKPYMQLYGVIKGQK